MITLKKTIALTFLSSLFFLYSCKHDPILTPGTAEVCFDSQVLPVIQSSCAKSGCHDGSGEQQALTNYNEILGLVSPGNPLQSELYTVITANPNLGNIMPPKPDSPLNSSQIDNIEIWILQGANPTTCTVECDTVNVTFTGSIQPINDTYCKGCHSGSNPSGGIMLIDYTTIKAAVEGGRYLGAIEQLAGFKPMPQGGSKLPDCNIVQINKWINQGMPNN
jgi:ribosomal protein S16